MLALILIIALIILVSVFSVQNAAPITVLFLAWRSDASLALIALIFFLAGMITGMAVLIHARRREKQRRGKVLAERTHETGPDRKPGMDRDRNQSIS